MKSHELAKILLANPDVELILQKDEEGNGYKECRGVDFNVLVTEDLDVYSADWDDYEAGMDSDDWEQMKQNLAGQHAVLFP